VQTIRFIAILLLTTLASSQDASRPKTGQSDTPKPGLPFVDENACPGKGKTVPNVKIQQNDRIYSSWKRTATSVGTLKAGEKVTVVKGVNVILEPDTAEIKYVGPDEPSSLKVGDVALGYGVEADSNILFWSKGVWFSEWIEAVAEKGNCGFTSGFGLGGCSINIVRDGVDDWWVQVRTSRGVTGWVLASKFENGKRWFGNFSDLCHYGED
jgi:hypothetical protein